MNLKQQDKNKNIKKILIAAGCTAVVMCGLVLLVLFSAGVIFNKEMPVDNTEHILFDSGKIKKLNTKRDVVLCDYEGLTIPLNETEPSEDEVNDEVYERLWKYRVLQDDNDLVIADGDVINIDYTGFYEGEQLQGTDTEGKGTDVTLGDGVYLEDFENALLGRNPGDEFDADVTFPSDYGIEPINGKTITFKVKINGVYGLPDTTEEFFAENFGGVAKDGESFFEYVKNQMHDENNKNWIKNYIISNCSIVKCPKKYLEYLELYAENTMIYEYEQYTNVYNTYYGVAPWDNVYDFFGITEEQFDESVKATAYATAAYNMIIQAIYEKEGLPKITDEDITRIIISLGYIEDDKDELYEYYGRGYFALLAMEDITLTDLVKKAS